MRDPRLRVMSEIAQTVPVEAAPNNRVALFLINDFCHSLFAQIRGFAG